MRRHLAKLADALTSVLVEHGPLPMGEIVERLGLDADETARLTSALDRRHLPGIYKRRRARRPRVIVGIEGDSRRWAVPVRGPDDAA